MLSPNNISLLATQNDQFRHDLIRRPGPSAIPGKYVLTLGIHSLSPDDRVEMVKRVVAFNDFTLENDPYGEHDFGMLHDNTHDVYWKIDYYDPSLKYGSENPADLSQTMRVLTIMLAEEY